MGSFFAQAHRYSMESTLAQHLLSRPAITDLVGQRIYSYYLPQGTSLPAIVYRIISCVPMHAIDGALNTLSARIQLDLLAYRARDISVLREQLRHELSGYTGTMAGAQVIRSNLVNEIGYVDEPTDGSDRWIYRRSVDYLIRYKITTPTLGVAGPALGGRVSLVETLSLSGGISLGGEA